MDYLTNYYKNLCEQLQHKVNQLSFTRKLLNESDTPTQFPVQDKPGGPLYVPGNPYWEPARPPIRPSVWPQDWRHPGGIIDHEYPTLPTLPPYPVWEHDSDPPPGWDGWWPDAPPGDPRSIPPDTWPRKPPAVG
jgi:hypothetical protein